MGFLARKSRQIIHHEHIRKNSHLEKIHGKPIVDCIGRALLAPEMVVCWVCHVCHVVSSLPPVKRERGKRCLQKRLT
jgi:hypothetical protein